MHDDAWWQHHSDSFPHHSNMTYDILHESQPKQWKCCFTAMAPTGRDDFKPPRLAQAAAGHVRRLLKGSSCSPWGDILYMNIYIYDIWYMTRHMTYDIWYMIYFGLFNSYPFLMTYPCIIGFWRSNPSAGHRPSLPQSETLALAIGRGQCLDGPWL